MLDVSNPSRYLNRYWSGKWVHWVSKRGGHLKIGCKGHGKAGLHFFELPVSCGQIQGTESNRHEIELPGTYATGGLKQHITKLER